METIHAMLSELEMYINDSKKVPLTSQSIVNREVIIEAITNIRDSLPEAVQEANRLLEKENQMMEEANLHYNNTIAEAESKARAITLEAKQRADAMYTDAKDKADTLYESAERKAHELVANAEHRAHELVAESSILVEANHEANRILTETRTQANMEHLATLGRCQELLQRAENTAIDIANELRDARLSYERER